MRSCAGHELIDFWEKEARVKFDGTEADPDNGREAVEADTYDNIIRESRRSLLKLVSRDRAIIDCLKIEQKDRSFMDFLADVEDQEKLCRMEEALTGDDLKRMSILSGMKDRHLAEKAIAEEFDLQQLIQSAINRESSKANLDAIQGRSVLTANRMQDMEEDCMGGELDAQINHLKAQLEELEVCRIQRPGKFSGRFKPPASKKKCNKCTYKHPEARRYPAEGRSCDTCGTEGHFAKLPLCPKSGGASGGKRFGQGK